MTKLYFKKYQAVLATPTIVPTGVVTMQTNNFALRLPHSMLDALRKAAADDGVAINQNIHVAVAEKLACRRMAEQFLQARA
jgi:hypothetical protein